MHQCKQPGVISSRLTLISVSGLISGSASVILDEPLRNCVTSECCCCGIFVSGVTALVLLFLLHELAITLVFDEFADAEISESPFVSHFFACSSCSVATRCNVLLLES